MLPDKLLQFRPLDLVRTDIFAISGLAALVFQVSGYEQTSNELSFVRLTTEFCVIYDLMVCV